MRKWDDETEKWAQAQDALRRKYEEPETTGRDWFAFGVCLVTTALLWIFAWVGAPTDGAALMATALGGVCFAGALALLVPIGQQGRSSSVPGSREKS